MVSLLSIFLAVVVAGVQEEFPLKNGKPTSKGIEKYVELMGDSIIAEYQDFVDDTLYNVIFATEDRGPVEGEGPIELGYYFPFEAVISRAELFEAYELEDLSPRRLRSFNESNRFVKGVMVHELSHAYINQVALELKIMEGILVHPEYESGIRIIRTPETFGAIFIEEGIAEYITERMGQLIPPKKPFVPKSLEELLKPENAYSVHYKYSAHVLRPFLDQKGIKEGIRILLVNPPPTYEEILNPSAFFERLKAIP
jgi:hypothetical protein